MHRFSRFTLAAVLCAFVFATLPRGARADEGMWTFDNFPSAKVAATYGFSPSPAWLDHVRLSSLRIAEGCSASFISPHGLVMTNHHCVVGCVEQLSTAQQNLVPTGFAAKTESDERKCPFFEIDQLVGIRDVTAQVQRALAKKSGNAANAALRAIRAKFEEGCGSSADVRCDLVSLYHGGVYDVYRYRRYHDVRLVFAPEFSVAQFGGDPDNFNFPRYDFDLGLLRVYDHDKPISNTDYLHWSKSGSTPGELVFVSGNPGGTSRELTVSQLRFERRYELPQIVASISEYRGLLQQFGERGADQARESQETLFFVENSFKVLFGHQEALLDPQFFGQKVREERQLRALVAKNAKLKAADGSAWDDIARIQAVRAKLFPRHSSMETYFARSGLLGDALTLVTAAEERTKPNAQRLEDYTDQALVNVQQELSAPIPVFKDLQELNLAYYFTSVRRELGTDDPFVRKMLGKESPEQLAHRLVSGTQLDDPKVRAQLYAGGEAAINASTDPLIVFARAINPDLLAEQKTFEALVTAPTRAAAERIAHARFVVYGRSVDPDATFTARLSYGSVKGFVDAQGKFVPPYTTIAGLYRRATGAPPYDLPQSWLDAKSSLDLSTPMNLSSTNDIIGGNSGSPLIDKSGDVVGLIFDGNIFSLSGDYGYEASKNRAVSVDSRALLAGLERVYHLDAIVKEIQSAR
ncbi:MAG TPA: S46 family peptidase [Candidatus Acidoferrales bacterium]|nr:S46 family peptidase [Candidatus Acidoferrales bacterium]